MVLLAAYICYFIHAVVVYSATVKALGGVSPKAFFKGMAPAMILAFGIAFSRMYNFMHFPTDIIAGIIVGVTSAVVCNCFFKKYVYNNKKEVS